MLNCLWLGEDGVSEGDVISAIRLNFDFELRFIFTLSCLWMCTAMKKKCCGSRTKSRFGRRAGAWSTSSFKAPYKTRTCAYVQRPTNWRGFFLDCLIIVYTYISVHKGCDKIVQKAENVDFLMLIICNVKYNFRSRVSAIEKCILKKLSHFAHPQCPVSEQKREALHTLHVCNNELCQFCR